MTKHKYYIICDYFSYIITAVNPYEAAKFAIKNKKTDRSYSVNDMIFVDERGFRNNEGEKALYCYRISDILTDITMEDGLEGAV